MAIVLLMGNVGADPETRFSTSGQKIISFRVASNTKRQGKEETTWWRVTIFGDRFDKMLTYVKKGSAVIITGEMTTQLWTDKEGRQHIQHEVIADSVRFSPFGRSDRSEQQSQQNYGASSQYSTSQTPQYASQPIPAYTPPQQAFAPELSDFSFGGGSEAHSQHEDLPF
ncbi:MAG: single-stranded DNA-binding protein [Parachlamydiaceae bacterium]